MLVKNASEADDMAVSDAAVCRCLIKDDAITVLRTVGIGEFGVVQNAVWTKDTAHQVSVCLSVCPAYLCVGCSQLTYLSLLLLLLLLPSSCIITMLLEGIVLSVFLFSCDLPVVVLSQL